METITIVNCGPILDHTVEIEPGVTLLTGENETGKSTAIAAIAALVGREGVPAIRDGAKTGLVQGCGVVLTLGKRSLRTGELDEIESLESRLDISKLVDPPLQQASAITRMRVKALLSLTNAQLDVLDFCGILPPEYRNEILAEDADKDPVEMAAKVKRRMEKRARQFEDEATKLQGTLDAYRRQLEDKDLKGEADATKLQRALQEALRVKSELDGQLRAHQSKAEEIAAAALAVSDAEVEAGASLEDAKAALCEATAALASRNNSLVAAVDARIAAEHALREAVATEKLAAAMEQAAHLSVEDKRDRVAEIEKRLADVAGLRALATSSAPEPPKPEALDTAQRAVDAAQAASDAGAVLRELLNAKKSADETHAKWIEALGKGEVFRAAAAGTDRVLSEALDCETLKMKEGELYYVEGERDEPFGRLSDGKRWDVAIRELAKAHRKQHGDRLCILCVPQRCWSEMYGDNRVQVWRTAKECNVAIVTALAGPGPLASRAWEPNGSGQ